MSLSTKRSASLSKSVYLLQGSTLDVWMSSLVVDGQLFLAIQFPTGSHIPPERQTAVLRFNASLLGVRSSRDPWSEILGSPLNHHAVTLLPHSTVVEGPRLSPSLPSFSGMRCFPQASPGLTTSLLTFEDTDSSTLQDQAAWDAGECVMLLLTLLSLDFLIWNIYDIQDIILLCKMSWYYVNIIYLSVYRNVQETKSFTFCSLETLLWCFAQPKLLARLSQQS